MWNTWYNREQIRLYNRPIQQRSPTRPDRHQTRILQNALIIPQLHVMHVHILQAPLWVRGAVGSHYEPQVGWLRSLVGTYLDRITKIMTDICVQEIILSQGTKGYSNKGIFCGWNQKLLHYNTFFLGRILWHQKQSGQHMMGNHFRPLIRLILRRIVNA